MNIYLFVIFLLESAYMSKSPIASEKAASFKPLKNICLNQKDPKNLTKKQILKEFAAGPCTPIALVPATIATRLLVQIDCEVLKAENPQIFKICGWNACSKRFYEIWKRVPKPEYKLWISSLLGPISMFKFSDRKNFCFSKFMRLAVDFTKPPEEAAVEQKGFRVRIYGSTDDTQSKFECGDKSISDLAGNKFLESTATKSYDPIIKMLKRMGYIAGLTYQSLPYDFRLSIIGNQLNKSFKNNIKRLNKLTRKKVVIVGHSFGNSNIYHQLLGLDDDFKKNKIKLWLGLGSPILGADKTIKDIIAGDSSLMYLHDLIGLHFSAEIETVGHMISVFELLPINPFINFADSDWMKLVKKRMDYEKGKVPYEDSGFAFLPKITDSCSPANYGQFSPGCYMSFTNSTEYFVVKIEDDEYKDFEIEQLFKKYNMTTSTMDYYNYTAWSRSLDLKHPGVPYVPVVLRSHKTPKQYYFKDDIRKYINYHRFPKPEVTFGYGDGSVNTNSMLIPVLKWAYEYDNGLEGTAPVKIVDMCSTYNLKTDVYDVKEPGKAYEITINEFQGIECDCIKDTSPNNCNHSVINQDTKLMELLHGILLDNNFTYSKNFEEYIDNLDDEYLAEITTKCPQSVFRNNEREDKREIHEVDI